MRKIIKSALILLNSLFVISYLLGFVAQFIPPDKFLPPAYFGTIFPIALTINILFLILWAIFRCWKNVILLMLMFIFTFSSIKETFICPMSRPKIPANFETVKLISYNVSTFGQAKHFYEIYNFIKKESPDIVCMQEYGYYNRSEISEKNVSAAFDSIYPYHHVWYKKSNSYRGWGIAVYSKYPIVNKEPIQYKSKINLSISSDIVICNDTIRLITNHLESNRLTMKMRNEYDGLTNNFSSKEAINITGNISNKMSVAFKIRAHQARIIRKIINESPYPVVVCGDFNDVPQSFAYHRIKGNLQDIDTKAGKCGYHYTFRESKMLVDIDHVMIPEDFIPISFQIKRINYSDHYPVIAYWAMPKRQLE